jgi:hypothetical protein
MNIEQELITAINMLLDEASAKGEAFTMSDIARAAIERCGAARVPLEAVADLARQVYIRKNEPWMALPGTKPRLKEWGDGVVPLAHKPTVMEILERGRDIGEPLEVTFARVGAAYPNLTGDELDAEVDAYQAWLEDRIERQRAQVRELDRVRAICQPVWDEDPSLTIGEALKVMASRGDEAAQRELDISELQKASDDAERVYQEAVKARKAAITDSQEALKAATKARAKLMRALGTQEAGD